MAYFFTGVEAGEAVGRDVCSEQKRGEQRYKTGYKKFHKTRYFGTIGTWSIIWVCCVSVNEIFQRRARKDTVDLSFMLKSTLQRSLLSSLF